MVHRLSNKGKTGKESRVLEGECGLPTPKAVIFDIGRVIVRLDLKRAMAPIATAMQGATSPSAKYRSAEEIWELIRSDQYWHAWQEGRMSSVEWHRHLMGRLDLSLSFGEFRDAWNLVLDPEPILGEDLFVRLSDRCQLALLSNTDPIHVESLEQRFTFGRHFPVRIYSCEIGASKPSPAIYRAALRSLQVDPHEALYIDDIQEFVGAARKMGMDAIHFETRDMLESELRRRRLY